MGNQFGGDDDGVSRLESEEVVRDEFNISVLD